MSWAGKAKDEAYGAGRGRGGKGKRGCLYWENSSSLSENVLGDVS